MKNNGIMERDAWGRHVRSVRPKVCADAPPLRKYLNVEVLRDADHKEVDPDTGMRRFTFVASTDAVDREGDILFPGGWQLDSYKENPVILWAHESWSYPIGRATDIGVQDNKLMVTVQFTPADVNPDGYRVYKLVEAGFVNAVSVGFRPRSWVWNDEHAGYDFQENELLEVSVVPVPANQEALLAAGIDGQTARWFAGISKGAAASVVLDTIIKEAINHNREVAVQPAGGETQHETTPQTMYLSSTLNGAKDGGLTTVIYTDCAGNTWDGTAWIDPDYDTPFKDYQPSTIQLPPDFVWPPPVTAHDKEVEMTKELQEALDKLTKTIEELPEAIATTVLDALADDDDGTVDDGAVDDGDTAVDQVVEGDPEPVADPVDDDDDDAIDIEDLTPEELRGMVDEALNDARTATTGRLPG
jgi:HK97 family phage prohead protease